LSFLFVRRVFLALVALESLLSGCWLVFAPEELFRLLQTEPRDLILWRGLGLLLLTHIPCLALAAWRPRAWRHLALVPLLGRALLAALWTWLLHSDRVALPIPVLDALLALALVWLPGLAWTLFPWSEKRGATARSYPR
jgi:hypothetical protein